MGIINFFLNSYYTGKELGYSSWMQLKDVAPDYGIAFLVSLSVYFIKNLPFNSWALLLIQITVGIIVLIITCNIFKIEEYCEIKDMLKSFKNKVVEWKKENRA